MNKKFWALMLVLPLCAFCGGKDNPEPDPDPDPEVKAEIVISGDSEFEVACEGGSGTLTFTSNVDWTATPDDAWLTVTPASGKASKSPVTVKFTCGENPKLKNRSTYIVLSGTGVEKNVSVTQAGNPMAGAAAEVKDGDKVLANSPLVEKFLTEVTYADKTYKEDTKVFDYYGGFDGKNLTWDNWETDWPDGDKPESYSIRWKKEDMESGKMSLQLSDELGWSGTLEIADGARYVNITNLVPNDKYTFKVTTASGKVLTQGQFTTTGSIHQCFFSGDIKTKSGVTLKGEGARNCRDLGGWKTLDGKTVKYRMVYRGGRLNEKWTPYPLNEQGQKEVLFEGIGAQLDLRGNSDVIHEPAVAGLDHCSPVIEQGGKTMLVNDAAKTKECFEFVVNSLRKGKPVHFHCSLGRDRTGTLSILLMGLLGVREGDIAKEYELTYFAPVGYSVSSSDKKSNPTPIFKNTRKEWVYSDVVPYFWELAGDGTFAEGVEKYLLTVAKVSQQDIDDFRNLMLE